MLKGALWLDWSLEQATLSRYVQGDRTMSFSELSQNAPEAAEHGDASFSSWRAVLGFRFGLSSRLEWFGSLPRVRQKAEASEADAHHRTEVFEGLGDLSTGLRYFISQGLRSQAAVRAGLTLPTGRLGNLVPESFLTHEEAAALGREVPKHLHLRAGDGVVAPSLGFEKLWHTGDNWMLFADSSVRVPLGRNRQNYRAAPSANMTLGPAYATGGKRAPIIGAFLETLYQGRDYFQGIRADGSFGRLAVPNTGRFQVVFLPRITWGASARLNLNLRLRFPVYTRIQGGIGGRDVQLIEDSFGVLISVSWLARQPGENDSLGLEFE